MRQVARAKTDAWRLALVIAIGCSGAPAPAPAASTTQQPVVAVESPPASNAAEQQETVRREEVAAAHRERLDEQATALAATCEKGAETAPACTPSCYVPEAADARAAKKIARAAEIVHVVCGADGGPYAIVGELARDVRVAKRTPKPAKKSSWQADVETAVATALQPDLARGDVVRVTGGWRSLVHPVSKERLRCAMVSHFARSLRPLDACGSHGAIACEAAKNPAAHGINLAHYRVLEARQLQRAGKSNECQQAALEAIAIARGMPRWRQYMALNTDKWKAFARYRTRFDGVLDEDALFAAAIALGPEAESVYVACGGSPNPKTTVAQEQAFHTCW